MTLSSSFARKTELAFLDGHYQPNEWWKAASCNVDVTQADVLKRPSLALSGGFTHAMTPERA
ncbi:hypothetical protein ACW9I7_27140 [Pseudomonas gingeri]